MNKAINTKVRSLEIWPFGKDRSFSLFLINGKIIIENKELSWGLAQPCSPRISLCLVWKSTFHSSTDKYKIIGLGSISPVLFCEAQMRW